MKDTPASKLIVIAMLCSVFFFLALTLIEVIPEIPVDIDFKPFFIPLAFIALVPLGKPTLAVALGASLGEFLRDMLEGYEIDDPPGAVGYIVALTLAGYIIHDRPLSKIRLCVAAVVAGFIQALFEAAAFLAFGEETLKIAVWSAAGNTVTHGLIMGAIPLIPLVPQLHGRIERYMGFAPKCQGTERVQTPARRRAERSAF
jgi:riboflavin transporter FmnP